MKIIRSEQNRNVITAKKNLIVGYFVAGYPDSESFFDVLAEAKKSGVDIFEIGFPAMHPDNDGPVIRDAMAAVDHSEVAKVSYWKRIREFLDAPIWLMGYREDLLTSGIYRELAKERCFDAIVIPDIEESEGRDLLDEMAAYDLDVVGFIGPNSKLKDSANCLAEFPIIYQMLYDGVTGIPVNNDNYKDILKLSRSMEDTYIFAGFGISTNERAKELIESGFDGVIIGTAIVKAVNQSMETMKQFIGELKETLRDRKNEYILAADLGTTAVKVSVVDGSNEVLAEQSREIQTYYSDGQIEQDPEEWYTAFCEAMGALLSEFSNKKSITDSILPKLTGICFSGQMQDLIMIPHSSTDYGNEQNASTGDKYTYKSGFSRQPRAILYSDARASEQASRIIDTIGEEEIVKVTGNHFDGSMPFAKLLWVRENQKETYESIDHIVFSSKDYIIYRLTGEFVTDVTTASTSGVMDIHEKVWAASWIEKVGMDPKYFPTIRYQSEAAGTVLAQAAAETGLPKGLTVYTGIGDAGATTLASGLVAAGEYNINLGTSGWVAQVSDDISREPGVFNLAYITEDTYINVTPFYNAGNVHKWISGMLTKDDEQKDKYNYVNRLLSESQVGSHGTMFLPYLNGERYPVSDSETRGAYIGITPTTTKQDMARACLEGVAFSLRTGFVSEIQTLSLIGGGAKVPVWCQIFADMLDHEVMVFQNPDYMPTIAVAVIARASDPQSGGYVSFMKALKDNEDCTMYKPDAEAVKVLADMYPKFCRIYPAVKEIRKF